MTCVSSPERVGMCASVCVGEGTRRTFPQLLCTSCDGALQAVMLLWWAPPEPLLPQHGRRKEGCQAAAMAKHGASQDVHLASAGGHPWTVMVDLLEEVQGG